jgi:hypothetical protein
MPSPPQHGFPPTWPRARPGQEQAGLKTNLMKGITKSRSRIYSTGTNNFLPRRPRCNTRATNDFRCLACLEVTDRVASGRISLYRQRRSPTVNHRSISGNRCVPSNVFGINSIPPIDLTQCQTNQRVLAKARMVRPAGRKLGEAGDTATPSVVVLH